ncbi:MAG: dihydroorotate dehydrogenase electron transfer subunit [Bacilli bacterium]|nr:dihydroorotate dehydrogenase electron transfer subunit [Bacilli bacterium]
MKNVVLKIKENKLIAKNTYRLVLTGDLTNKYPYRPGSFVNLLIPGFYLRRPISICDINNKEVVLIYKVVGKGTLQLSKMKKGEINTLVDMGNGYNISPVKNTALLVGGGAGIPPMYYLAKELLKKKKHVITVLGFNSEKEIFYDNEFKKLGVKVVIATLDGSVGVKGLVTDAMKGLKYDYVYACGPIPMLKAIYKDAKAPGQYSLEERMGCGFGVCRGCSIKTKAGIRRVCKDGPVFKGEDIIW